jgi:hypothetical protein
MYGMEKDQMQLESPLTIVPSDCVRLRSEEVGTSVINVYPTEPIDPWYMNPHTAIKATWARRTGRPFSGKQPRTAIRSMDTVQKRSPR